VQGGRPEDPFDAFAALLHAPRTLAAAEALLSRLEARLVAAGVANPKSGAGTNTASSGSSKAHAMLQAAQAALFPKSVREGKSVPRYPVRIFLAAYMIRVRLLSFNSLRCLRVLPYQTSHLRTMRIVPSADSASSRDSLLAGRRVQQRLFQMHGVTKPSLQTLGVCSASS